MAKEHPKIDKIKEVASRVGSKIRNLENAINAARSAPPDPAIAEQFDDIQRDVETLKTLSEYSCLPSIAGTRCRCHGRHRGGAGPVSR